MTTEYSRIAEKNQKGAALIVALVMLLAITLLGVASLRSGLFHEKMSLNSQSETLTFMGAESAINAVLSYAWQIGQNDTDESFFTDAVLGTEQINCISKAGLTNAACGSVNDAMDVRSTGVLFAQSKTVYVNQTKVFNSDPDSLAYHNFLTNGVAYFRDDLELPFATENQQAWKKLGVATSFSVSEADVKAAAN